MLIGIISWLDRGCSWRGGPKGLFHWLKTDTKHVLWLCKFLCSLPAVKLEVRRTQDKTLNQQQTLNSSVKSQRFLISQYFVKHVKWKHYKYFQACAHSDVQIWERETAVIWHTGNFHNQTVVIMQNVVFIHDNYWCCDHGNIRAGANLMFIYFVVKQGCPSYLMNEICERAISSDILDRNEKYP